MRPIDDRVHLRPVVRQVARTPEDAEVDKALQPPSGPASGPPEPERHELDERPLPGRALGEMDLDRGRDEGQILPRLGILDLQEDRP